jgi:hypothetical protein
MSNIAQEQPVSHVFKPSEHLIQIRSGQTSKDYLPIQWRLVWFRSIFPQGEIETQMLELDMERETQEETYVWNAERKRSEKVIKQAKGFCLFHAVVKDGVGGMATGTKSEKAASFPDYIEKAETGSIGHALAALGFGTQFCGDEWEEAHRVVDAPVDRTNGNNGNNGNNGAARSNAREHRPAANDAPVTATEQQLSGIRNLCDHLGKTAPDKNANLSFVDASKMLQQLTAEYRQSKQQNKAK